VIDRWTLRRDGTHAIYLEKDAVSGETRIARIETVAGNRGQRPWTARPDTARRQATTAIAPHAADPSPPGRGEGQHSSSPLPSGACCQSRGCDSVGGVAWGERRWR